MREQRRDGRGDGRNRDGTIKNETSAVVDVTSHLHKALALTVGSSSSMAAMILSRIPIDSIPIFFSRISSLSRRKATPLMSVAVHGACYLEMCE